MLNKNDIINLAFLKLGEQNQLYNINISDRMKIAELLFKEVIREIAIDTNFTFNARTIDLTLNLQQTNSRGEYRYNKPTDYLNRIWVSDKQARIENEFIYSTEANLEMCYCFQMDLADYPESIIPYVTTCLAIKLAEAFDSYYEKIPRLEAQKMDITNKLLVSEGLPFEIER